jgi:hypothetical protein
LIIYATPDLCPGGTKYQNKDQRQFFTKLEICPRAPTSIIYRPQSHPSLLRAYLWLAYLEILQSLALSASVSKIHVSSTKDILCRPWSDLSRMTRSGLCVCAMTEDGIDRQPGACSPSKLEWAQPSAVVGLVLQLGAGAVEGQDPQVVHVKGCGDLVVECLGWTRGVQQQQHRQL